LKLADQLKVLTQSVVEMKEDINDKLVSLKNEDSRFKNEVENLVSSVNDMKKEIFLSFKMFPRGIQNNLHVSKLTENGYSYVYNKPYNHKTTSSEMDEIKKSCLQTTSLCLGGRDSTNGVLLVVSCGLCSVVFTKTAKNTPNLHNGAYWYYTPDGSMGFSPNSIVNQGSADTFDQSNNQRVSWHLNVNKLGGYRLGSLNGLNNDARYYKVILKSDD
jgi:hypothetical protein